MKAYGSFRRTGRRAALVIVVLALFALLFFAWQSPQKGVTSTIESRSPVLSARPEAANPEGPHPRGARTQNPHANTDTARGPVRTPNLEVVDELCGVKGPDLRRAQNEAIGQHVMRVTQDLISRWKSSLAKSDDSRRRAIGLALENASPEPFGDKPKDTPVNNSLVLLAIDSNDSLIYALALGQCATLGFDMPPGPCQGLSWEHWANLDSDNAVPWLWLAAKASSYSDDRGVEEALSRATMASRFEAYGSTAIEIALSALPRDAAPLDKTVAGASVNSIYSIGVPAIQIAATLCSDTAVQQPTRKRQCTSVANALADKGPTMIDLAVAMSLADRLGFPAERQATLQKERNDAGGIIGGPNPWRYTSAEGSDLRLEGDFRCDTVLGYNRYVDALEAAGGSERAALAAIAQTTQHAK